MLDGFGAGAGSTGALRPEGKWRWCCPLKMAVELQMDVVVQSQPRQAAGWLTGMEPVPGKSAAWSVPTCKVPASGRRGRAFVTTSLQRNHILYYHSLAV